ncbi:MAG TPA: O-methyltransferase [Gemmatimonadales bacterium]|nr:O-methyltransferase [Gemmatimonadales bacterium]
MVIVNPRIERYLRRLLPPRDPVLVEMEQRAGRERIPIVGPVVGRLLYMLARITRARRVMELGSAIGYSTIWWARAVGPRGRVWYTDGDPANASEASRYFRRAKVARRVSVMVGDAVECMRSVRGNFDIVFCDIDKHGYPAAFEAAWPRIRPGGLFVCDNTLWSGRVADRAVRDVDTTAVRRLNLKAFTQSEAFAVLVPIRDGLGIVLKERGLAY